jgi:5'-nucleotidase
MKIVITNDDGFGEPGIEALQNSLQTIGEVVVVAPKRPHSFAGHRVTMKEDIPVEQVDSGKFVVDGTPADCTRLALKALAPDADWVVAGINPGANLGTDVYQSGTVAAAREAAILRVRAIAISQYVSRGGAIAWKHTREHALGIIMRLLEEALGPGAYWNVNLPHPLNSAEPVDYKVCPLDRNAHDYSFLKDGDAYRYQGIIHDRPRDTGGDVDVCFGGRIAVTKLAI